MTMEVDKVPFSVAAGAVLVAASGCSLFGGGERDVSEEGQVAYACALASYILEEHGSAEAWGGIGQEPAWHQAGSVGVLFGGGNMSGLVGHEDQAGLGQDVVAGVSQINVESIDENLEAIAEGCDN